MKHFIFLGLLCAALSVQAQQKKPVSKPYLAPKKSAATPASKQATQTSQPLRQSDPVQRETVTTPATKSEPQRDVYDKYQQTSRKSIREDQQDDEPEVSSVLKINFMRLIIKGVDLEFEQRIARKSSVIFTGGYYFGGILKGGYRLGLDYRQYLGRSLSPSGLYVSAGAMGNFIPVSEKSLVGQETGAFTGLLLNLRGLVGYQFKTGHFVFDIAAGGGYAMVSSTKAIVAKDGGTLPIGFLPAFKMSLGYAF